MIVTGFRTGTWAKIWSIEPGDRSTKVRISISKKNKKTDKYEQDFSGFVTLAGTAHKEASNLKVGDTFKIGDCEVTSRYDKDKNKEYINFTVYSFDGGAEQTSSQSSSAKAAAPAPASNSDEDLPF